MQGFSVLVRIREKTIQSTWVIKTWCFENSYLSTFTRYAVIHTLFKNPNVQSRSENPRFLTDKDTDVGTLHNKDTMFRNVYFSVRVRG